MQRYFGTLRKAMRAAGLPYTDLRAQELAHWTEELVIQTLRDLHAEGFDLRHRTVKARKQPLFYAAKQFFGSYTDAVSEAGIDYWAMSQLHLKRERLRDVRRDDAAR